MNKLLIPLALFALVGCASKPVTPSRIDPLVVKSIKMCNYSRILDNISSFNLDGYSSSNGGNESYNIRRGIFLLVNNIIGGSVEGYVGGVNYGRYADNLVGQIRSLYLNSPSYYGEAINFAYKIAFEGCEERAYGYRAFTGLVDWSKYYKGDSFLVNMLIR